MKNAIHSADRVYQCGSEKESTEQKSNLVAELI